MKKQILDLLKNSLQKEEEDFARHEMLADCLAPWEGKTLTLKAQKCLPDGYALRHSRYGHGYEITAGKYTGHDGQQYDRTHWLRTAPDGTYTREAFNDADSPYFAGAKDRAEKLRHILENPGPIIHSFVELQKAFDKLRQAAALVETTSDSYHNPAYHEILRLVNVPSDLMSSFRFGFKK